MRLIENLSIQILYKLSNLNLIHFPCSKILGEIKKKPSATLAKLLQMKKSYFLHPSLK